MRGSKRCIKTLLLSIVETPKDDESSNNGNNNQGSTDSKDNSGGTTTTEKTPGKSSDSTTKPGVLPQTGEGSFIIMIVAIVSLIGISFFLYKRVAFYKDIK